jgi:hypothetical protein
VYEEPKKEKKWRANDVAINALGEERQRLFGFWLQNSGRCLRSKS